MSSVVKPQNHKQHKLSPTNAKYIPSVWLFLDTETLPEETPERTLHHFNIGWTCLWIRSRWTDKHHTDWQYHTNKDKFNEYLHFIARTMGDIIIAGHNIFFDLQASGFFKHFSDLGWHLEFYYDQALTYILKLQLKGSKITILSTTNWFDFSLKRLGEHLGLVKLDFDFETGDPAELKRYCRRDVEIIVKAVQYYITFIQEHDLGKFSLTKASQAFTAFRHRFMDHEILIHNDSKVQDLERSAYIGGRVEAFEIGHIKGSPFTTLDINAMYPTVMKAQEYPYKLVAYHENEDPHTYLDILKSFAVIAEIEVDTPLALFGVKYKSKTVFPVGRFRCFVCSTGLREAIKSGYVIRILRAAIYRKADLFTSYVDYFHKLRVKYSQENNAIMLLFCKYMHNSLYGKFGQLKITTDITETDTENEYFRESVFNAVTGHNVVITRFMNRELVQYPEGEGENSNVAIAAHITENARFVLWDLINTAMPKNVIYCDTDSIKIRVRDLNNVKHLLHPSKLGALKVENESHILYIGGSKNYRTEDSRKIKGIPKNAKEIRPGVFQFLSFRGQVSHLRLGLQAGAEVRTVQRQLTATYDKGIVLPTGKVLPFMFPLT